MISLLKIQYTCITVKLSWRIALFPSTFFCKIYNQYHDVILHGVMLENQSSKSIIFLKLILVNLHFDGLWMNHSSKSLVNFCLIFEKSEILPTLLI